MTANKPLTFLTVKEVADRLGCHPQTVYNRVAAREWPHVRLTGGRNIHFTEENIKAILALATVQPAPPKQPRRRKAA